MNVRIVKIPGNRVSARNKRLEETRSWMEKGGWQLVDYSEQLGSAVFEREEATGLNRYHPTRWLPGPRWYRPDDLVRRMAISPARALLVGAITVATTAVFLGLMSQSGSMTGGAEREEKPTVEETWLFVNAHSLNIRVEPDSNSQITGALYRNQKALVTERFKGWARITHPQRGYVAVKFLQDHPAP